MRAPVPFEGPDETLGGAELEWLFGKHDLLTDVEAVSDLPERLVRGRRTGHYLHLDPVPLGNVHRRTGEGRHLVAALLVRGGGPSLGKWQGHGDVRHVHGDQPRLAGLAAGERESDPEYDDQAGRDRAPVAQADPQTAGSGGSDHYSNR